MNRRLLLFLAVLAALMVMPVAGAQETAPLDVIVLSGPLDQSAIRFVEETLEEVAANRSQAAIVQLDSEGALSGDIEELIGLFREPPLPLVVWVGDAPAVAYGGAAQLLLAAPMKTAAPGAEIGSFSAPAWHPAPQAVLTLRPQDLPRFIYWIWLLAA